MVNKSKHETAALEAACGGAGTIIENMIESGCGSDFGEWPAEAFEAMVEAAVDAYSERLKELAGSDEAPF